MDLGTWVFIFFIVLFTGFLLLEGFDYGVGILLSFLGKADIERKVIIKTIAPVWLGNEVWLITAGAILFAAFPHVYATLFSGLYFALFFILFALILRGMAIEFRDKDESNRWRRFCDWLMLIGNVLPAFLWGVAIANLAKGLLIDESMQYAGTFMDLLSPYTLLGGASFTLVFVLHGAAYLRMKLDGHLNVRAGQLGAKIVTYGWIVMLGFIALTWMGTAVHTNLVARMLLMVSLLAFYLSGRYMDSPHEYLSFLFSSSVIIALAGAVFIALYPRMILSVLNPAWSLTIYNAVASPLSLRIMIKAMAIILPVMILFQGWKYYIFRQKESVAREEHMMKLPLLREMNRCLEELIMCANVIAGIMDKVRGALKKK